MIRVTDIPEQEIELSAIRSGGPGGQHVNKVSSAIHLRFDVMGSSLPAAVKQRLRHLADQRVTSEGVIVIKAQSYRSQDKNKQEALDRLDDLLTKVQRVKKTRKPTRPSRASVKRQQDGKRKRSDRKRLRGKVDY